MGNLSDGQLAKLQSRGTRIQTKAAANPEGKASLEGVGDYLKQCETKLIRLMTKEQPPFSEPGKVEFGLALYLIRQYDLDKILFWIHFPPTEITEEMLQGWDQVLKGPGVVNVDGTLAGYGKYEALDFGWLVGNDPDDYGWLEALFGYMETVVDPWGKVPFGTDPVVRKLPDSLATVKIALIGDWGTGDWKDGSVPCPALGVMAQVSALKPDMVIHLGDVYYAGTEEEEKGKAVALWPKDETLFPQGSFAVNSNHEMYSGGRGYFDILLKSPRFLGQQGTSYFAIEYGEWLILGLDSAYYDRSLLYQDGHLGDPQQGAFIKKMGALDRKKVVILTHHHGLTIDGASKTPLWGDIHQALGRKDPAYWYWGHIHNGIVYSAKAAVGQTKARCVGHSAIPYGDSYGLQGEGERPIETVEYYANTPFPHPDNRQENRVLNGFLLLTFTKDSVSEELYNQDGKMAWKNQG